MHTSITRLTYFSSFNRLFVIAHRLFRGQLVKLVLLAAGMLIPQTDRSSNVTSY